MICMYLFDDAVCVYACVKAIEAVRASNPEQAEALRNDRASRIEVCVAPTKPLVHSKARPARVSKAQIIHSPPVMHLRWSMF